jgi:hypothetical protein
MTGPFILFLAERATDAKHLLAATAAHFAIGGGLFYGVLKFFEAIENRLSVDTKLEIAVWLLDLQPAEALERWPSTFLKLFNVVFGERHISWKCFWRSWLASVITTAAVLVSGAAIKGLEVQSYYGPVPYQTVIIIGILCSTIGNFLPDYLSLWKTRYLLNQSLKQTSILEQIISLIADFFLSIPLAVCGFIIDFIVAYMVIGTVNAKLVFGAEEDDAIIGPLALFGLVASFIPAFLGRIWLLLYVGSGVLLKGARGLAGGLTIFNRCFDIENHPLTSIGLIAGTVSAVGYWLLAALHWVP